MTSEDDLRSLTDSSVDLHFTKSKNVAISWNSYSDKPPSPSMAVDLQFWVLFPGFKSAKYSRCVINKHVEDVKDMG